MANAALQAPPVPADDEQTTGAAAAPAAPSFPAGGRGSSALAQMGVDPGLIGMLDDARASHHQLSETALETLNTIDQRRSTIASQPTPRPAVPDLPETPEPPPNEIPSNGMRVYGQFLPVLAMLGGALVKRDATAALRTGAAAARAARANDAQNLELQHSHWEDQVRRITSEREGMLQQYQAALQDANLSLSEKQSILNALAGQENNIEMRVRIANGDLAGVAESVNTQMRAVEALRTQQRQDAELNEKVRHNQAMETRRAGGAQGLSAVQNRIANANDVLNSITAARNLAGMDGTTGARGQAFRGVGGTQAHDLQAAVNTIQANIAFDQLQAMRAASPTGGALGSVSERELELLQSAIASLDTSQTRERFLAGLQAVQDHYTRALNALQQDLQTDQSLGLTGGGPAAPPAVGEVVDGYRFNGGDPADQNNWSPAGGE